MDAEKYFNMCWLALAGKAVPRVLQVSENSDDCSFVLISLRISKALTDRQVFVDAIRSCNIAQGYDDILQEKFPMP